MVKLVLIDGNSLANRAFYAIPPLTNRDGFSTNAIYGFINMLKKIQKEEQPAYLGVAFDAGRKVFRHDLYEGYKGSRKGMPDELREQMPVLRDVLRAMGVFWLEMEGYEADDLIGTLASRGSREGLQVRIVTGDRDCLQLIDENTMVLYTRRGISELERFDEAHLHETYGLQPWQIVELKGLMGDSSDDIPGIPGVGEKTALKLLADHESVEGVLAAADVYQGKKLGERLTEHRDLARLSRKLAEICKDVPLSVDMDDLKPSTGDREERIRLFRQLEFRGLLADAQKEEGNADTDIGAGVAAAESFGGVERGASAGSGDASDATEAEKSAFSNNGAGVAATDQIALFGEISALADPADIANMEDIAAAQKKGATEVRTLWEASQVAAYLSPLREGDRLYIVLAAMDANKRSVTWQGLGLLRDGETPIYLPVQTLETETSPKGDPNEGNSLEDDPAAAGPGGSSRRFEGILTVLKPYLESSAIVKTCVDVKKADLYFRTEGLHISAPYEDLHLMSYLLNPAQPWQMLVGLEELEPDKLIRSIKEETKAGRAYWTGERAGALLAAMALLIRDQRARLTVNNLWGLYKEAEEPLALILGEMEWQGICIAPGVLVEQGSLLKEKIATVEKEIYRLAEQSFNINSPKQLGEILFDKLGLPRGKKTKTGYSTDAETLENLQGEHPIVGEILAYRQYAKLQSTYVEGLLSIMDPETNRIHSSLNQTITVTGRLSSTEPNLQNIPIRMEEGRQIRKAFVPSPGCCLLSGDYSQIELRILAHFCGDEALRTAFIQGQDIHRSTAAEVFGVSPDAVTPQQRRAAKAVNFGMIYGISDFGLAQDLGITRGEAKAYMDRYFSRYPGVKVYFDRLLMEAAEKGYVETLFCRRRYLPELKSGNYHTRSFGQRAAMNAPLQGTAADIMKLAMVKVNALLEQEDLRGTMVLQVHDELLFDMPVTRVQDIKDKIKGAMESVAELSVPLLVDMKTGGDWYAMEES